MTSTREDVVKIMADAMYQEQVRQARSLIDRTEFSAADMAALFERLTRESETAKILIFFTFLDDKIDQLIRLRLHHLHSQTDIDRLFGPNGPLSTFNNRVLVAFHLGWLSQEQKAHLDTFRRIRNKFAHRAFQISFDDPEGQEQLKRVQYELKGLFQIAGPEYDNHDDLDAGQKMLCSFALLACNTFLDLLVLPAALALHISPRDVCRTYDEGPGLIKNIRKDAIRAILAVAHPDKW